MQRRTGGNICTIVEDHLDQEVLLLDQVVIVTNLMFQLEEPPWSMYPLPLYRVCSMPHEKP